MALTEVLVEMDKTRAAELFPEIEVGATGDEASVRRGFSELLEAIPLATKMDFVPYISWASQATWIRTRTPGSKQQHRVWHASVTLP